MSGRTVNTDGLIKPFDRMPIFSGAANGSNAYADILVVNGYGCLHQRFDAPDYKNPPHAEVAAWFSTFDPHYWYGWVYSPSNVWETK